MTTSRHQPVGVGGWLLVLMVVLVLEAAGAFAGEWLAAPRPGSGPAWLHAFAWSWAALHATICTVVVWRMARRRDPGTIRLAIVALWATLALQTAKELLVICTSAGFDHDLIRDVALGAFLVAAMNAGWTAYLMRSERVANTYRPDGPAHLAAVFD